MLKSKLVLRLKKNSVPPFSFARKFGKDFQLSKPRDASTEKLQQRKLLNMENKLQRKQSIHPKEEIDVRNYKKRKRLYRSYK